MKRFVHTLVVVALSPCVAPAQVDFIGRFNDNRLTFSDLTFVDAEYRADVLVEAQVHQAGFEFKGAWWTTGAGSTSPPVSVNSPPSNHTSL